MSRQEIKRIHGDIAMIAEDYMRPLLHLTGTTILFAGSAPTGEEVEINIERPVGDIDFRGAGLRLEVAKLIAAPHMPNFTVSTAREYTLTPTSFKFRLNTYVMYGRSFIRNEVMTQSPSSLKGMPVEESNILRRLANGMISPAEIQADIAIAQSAFPGGIVINQIGETGDDSTGLSDSGV